MVLSWWQCATVAMGIGRVSGLAVSYLSRNASMPSPLSSRQSIEDFDPDDLSYIQKLAAIGDSYSAGIGAGNRLGSVLNALDPHSGGNDVQLLEILNQCIFQWGVLSESQVLIAKAAALEKQLDWAIDYDWDKLALGCEGQLAESGRLIDSGTFAGNLDKVIAAAQSKLSLKYAEFFATDMSPECDDVTWSTWLNELYNKFTLEKAYLSQGRRRQMNNLVDKVNKKLFVEAEAVERAGNSVKFIDYDKYVGYYGGRYCETGVDESTSEAKTRTGLMFYELNTWDPLGSSPWKRSNDDALQGTFDGEQDILAQVTLLLEPDAELAHQNRIEGDVSTTSIPAPADNNTFTTAALDIQVPSFLPDGYGRVFHPQILLHAIIAERIIFEMINTNIKSRGSLPLVPEVASFGTCELDQSTSTTLRYKGTESGKEVKPGTKLRILGVGDSITVGFLSDRNGGDGNGYRHQLRDDLSGKPSNSHQPSLQDWVTLTFTV
ncbi:uncharacterized protein ColSpa_11419 [Colletotrichum spaethianum]|uniref:Uncharacterized protein n=1 Tax=Colletotrichum spaethianum TaxID=700344 RepID=A0AA37PFH4_9PEZI|nr:uncharacterized protein ColSpa_11419 [Colletotrichum spaethianum]GKT51238.1 hypothetical protein ColSpa_11419 [Colletotrichum spaethianum]